MAGNRAHRARGRAYAPAGGRSLPEPLPFLLSSAFLFSFCCAIFCPIMQASFYIFHFKKFSTINLICFYSYCSCFLLFMKSLNIARISFLFCERPHPVQFSVHCNPTQVSADFRASLWFPTSLPYIRHLCHVAWAPFSHMALLLPLSASAVQPPLLCVDLTGVCPWPMCVKALHRAVTAPVAVCAVFTCAHDK